MGVSTQSTWGSNLQGAKVTQFLTSFLILIFSFFLVMNQSRGARRGRRNRAANTARPSAALQRYKAEMHGHENKLQMVDPTAVNLRPFNTIRLRFTYDTTQVGVSFGITVKEVVKNLLDQLGLTTQASTLVVFKVQRMDIFATAASGIVLDHRTRPIPQFFS